MRPSPLQLKHYVLTRLRLEPREEPSFNFSDSLTLQPTDWNGVNLRSNIDFAWADGEESDPRSFAMTLRIAVPNESGKAIDYVIDVEVMGFFELAKNIPLLDREDIGKVNGASMLYGVCRDVVYSASARFPKAPLILPTMNFLDLKGKRGEEVTHAPAASAPTITTHSAKPRALKRRRQRNED